MIQQKETSVCRVFIFKDTGVQPHFSVSRAISMLKKKNTIDFYCKRLKVTGLVSTFIC